VKLVPLIAAVFGALLPFTPSSAQEGPQSLQAISLNAGMHNIRAEFARSPHERQIGLMNRPSMPPNDGMLFEFEQPAIQCFWMRNTLIPLSAAFVDEDGTVVNIVDMKPQSLDSHCSAKPVRYVLEMNQGWFSKRGIKAGGRISGPPFNR